MNNLQQPKNVIKIVLIIGVIAFLGFFVHKYLQFRTAFLEKQRIELAREEKKKKEEAEQQALHEKYARCKTAKPILEVTYKDKLLSVNIDCVWAGDVLKEISKKIAVKIDFNSKGLTTTDLPISFSNLSIKDGLDIIGKSEVGTGDNFISRYLIDKNIWSFDKVIIEVKDPPKDGVTHIVETKDSLDFVKADGTNKKTIELLDPLDEAEIKKTDDGRFIAFKKYSKSGGRFSALEFFVLNNQGDVQWKFNEPNGFYITEISLNYNLSNNGQYMVATESGECSPKDCNLSSYIITKNGMKEIKYIYMETTRFSQDGNFFAGYVYPDNSFTIFDKNGNEIYNRKTLEEIKLIPGFEK